MQEYWERFEPRVRRDGDRIVKAIAAFMTHDGRRAVVECAAIEGFLRQTFLVEMIQKDSGVLVRLFHGSGPEKTEGVRFCLAWIGRTLLAQDPGCRWGAENLGVPLPQDP